MKVYEITPMGKPRMTQRDKWKQRPCVMRYRAFKDQIRAADIDLPLYGYWVVFVLPMPKSWAKGKREYYRGEPHRAKPDKDNLEKALLDAIHTEDCQVWDGRASKLWGDVGRIVLLEPGEFLVDVPCGVTP